MKSGHRTRQNRLIVNATADTSDAISRTHACAAILRPQQTTRLHTIGRGNMNARRSNWGRLCSKVILTIFAAGYETVAAGGFKASKSGDV